MRSLISVVLVWGTVGCSTTFVFGDARENETAAESPTDELAPLGGTPAPGATSAPLAKPQKDKICYPDANPSQTPDMPAGAMPLFTTAIGESAGAIGVAGGRAYWTFETQTCTASPRAGIASVPVEGGAPEIISPAKESAPLPYGGFRPVFRVGKHHVVFQHMGGPVEVVVAGTTSRVPLPQSTDACTDVASDATHAYCLTTEVPAKVLAWDIATGARTIVKDGIKLGLGLQEDGGALFVRMENPVNLYEQVIARLDLGGAMTNLVTTRCIRHFNAESGALSFTTHCAQDGRVFARSANGALSEIASTSSYSVFAIVDGFRPQTLWMKTSNPTTVSLIERRSTSGVVAQSVALPIVVNDVTVDATHVYFTHAGPHGGIVWRAPVD